MADQPKIVNVLHSKVKNVNVTALKFHSGYLIAGQSGDLHLYSLSSDEFSNIKRVQSLEVFQSQNIYGIAIKDFKILVFGGKRVSILSGDQFTNLSITNSWTAEDWILDGVWTENDCLVLLTAHNVLLQFSYNPVKLVAKAYCIERCILHLREALFVIEVRKQDYTLFLGYRFASNYTNIVCMIKKVYIYSGKILGTQWEDLVVLAGTVYQEVVIWSPSCGQDNDGIPVLHHLKGHKGVIFSITYDYENLSIASTSDDRTVRVWSVKFPENDCTVRKWADAEINLTFTAFGHTARVWRAAFTSSGYLVSVGEDSQIILWNRNGDILNRWEHNGEVRCLDYCNEYVAVGGNGIIVRSISSLPEISSFNLSCDFGTPRRVLLSRYGTPLVFTDKGSVLYKEGDEIFHSVCDERFMSYSVAAKSLCHNYIVQGGIDGDLILYEVKKNNIMKSIDINFDNERIYSLTWANCKTVIANGENGHLSLLVIRIVFGQLSLEKIKEFILPPSKERWITCSLVVEDFLICGDRMGSLHLYSLKSNIMEPVHSLSKLHESKGVSDVKYIRNIIYSIGRDGTLRELTISNDNLLLVSTLKLPMDWAANIIETKTFGMVIAGFHDTNFLFWSADERITLLTLECGGGHRSFDHMFDEKKGNIVLSFIRMKDVKYLNCPLSKLVHHTVLVGYHTKPINSACVLSLDNERAIALTGSEDNSLKLCKFEKDSWIGCSTYIRHISAVRTLKCIENIVVSAGARAQLIVWELHENSTGELRLKEIKSHMIRDESEHRRSWKDALPLVDPETRYMDIEVAKLGENCFMIIAGCSDGMLRIFEYNQTTQHLVLKKAVESEQGCLLKVCIFNRLDTPVVITGGTDGSIAFWHSPFDQTPFHKHRVHSLGINAIDHVLLKNHVVVGTGGDDSSIVLSVFSLNANNQESLSFNIVEHVHTCQVSGLKITEKYVITAALDQKLCLFHWSFDGTYLKTKFLSHFITSIPDIHGILTWPAGKESLNILVYGCGFQLVHFDGSLIPL